ncbi:hypothetical protein F383_32984 [Gossypium arboreum]|uniref:Uncharacterized protein n=1 Tax=Gossypium arboreum TaxID=29729 RepID=A0A0B0N776_GOSAR|nr:hypothetical protein F383_32984 [Gossypium arboreum]
MMFLDDPRARS